MFVLFYVHVRRPDHILPFRFTLIYPPEPFYQRMTSLQTTFLTDVVPVRLNGSNGKVYSLRNLLVCVLFCDKLQDFYFSRGQPFQRLPIGKRGLFVCLFVCFTIDWIFLSHVDVAFGFFSVLMDAGKR